MAKRKRYYYEERQSNRRKLVLVCLLLLAGGAVAWKFYSESRSQKSEAPSPSAATPPIIASQLEVPAEPPVTTPEQIVRQVREAVKQIPQRPIESTLTVTKPVTTERDRLEFAQSKTPSKPPQQPMTSPGYPLLQKGRQAIQTQDYFIAGKFLSQAVQAGLNPVEKKQARKLINQASNEWLLSPKFFKNDLFSSRYKVASGDMLVNIGKKLDVPYQLIMKINGIRNAAQLRAGQTLKVIQGPFHVKISRHRYLLDVFLGDMLVKSYPVGLGQPGRQTPTGLWRVRPGKKQVNPAWTDVETGKHYYPDDPKNPLGERWISLEGVEGDAVGRDGFGIHGTIKPHEIGQSTSRGCIRLHNKDVIELYDLLAEGKSNVWVME